MPVQLRHHRHRRHRQQRGHDPAVHGLEVGRGHDLLPDPRHRRRRPEHGLGHRRQEERRVHGGQLQHPRHHRRVQDPVRGHAPAQPAGQPGRQALLQRGADGQHHLYRQRPAAAEEAHGLLHHRLQDRGVLQGARPGLYHLSPRHQDHGPLGAREGAVLLRRPVRRGEQRLCQ